jgi:hypothetical protein
MVTKCQRCGKPIKRPNMCRFCMKAVALKKLRRHIHKTFCRGERIIACDRLSYEILKRHPGLDVRLYKRLPRNPAARVVEPATMDKTLIGALRDMFSGRKIKATSHKRVALLAPLTREEAALIGFTGASDSIQEILDTMEYEYAGAKHSFSNAIANYKNHLRHKGQ